MATETSVDPDRSSGIRILVVEDDSADVQMIEAALRKGGLDAELDCVQTEENFCRQIQSKTYDLVLADYDLRSWNGLTTVRILRGEELDVPVIMVCGALGELTAVECIKQGAADYVLKDHLTRLPQSARRAIRETELRSEHRRSREELARSNRDLEQFAYVASHDLQEPLRMVATYTQLLAERYEGKLDETADKYIRYVVDGAVRMQILVQDLLTFSRLGRQGSAPKLTDCNLIFQDAINSLRAVVNKYDARISCAQLPTVVADSSQVLQLFQNLLANALKFRGADAPVIHVAAAKHGREWIFSVSDNGIGIAPEHGELIFALFKRLHTHDEYPGSGIGLALCQKIAEQHGGRIWVESQGGPGSTFKFALPAKASGRNLRSRS